MSYYSYRSIGVILCAGLGIYPLLGQDASLSQASAESIPELEELIITASRTESSSFLVPYLVDKITEKDILDYNYRTIPEALQYTPGVMVQKTAYGHGSPYVRGFTGRQNLLLVDGVRMNNSTWRSGPAQYWNTIDALSLSQMELVKGQGSVLYGSDSIGGTLNVISQSAQYLQEEEGKFFSHGSAYYRFGSNGSSSVSRLESNIGEGRKWGFHLGLSDKIFNDIHSDGHKWPNTGYHEYDYDARFDYQINKKTVLTLASRTLYQDDVWRTHKTKWTPSWHGTSIGKDDDFHYDQRQMLNYARLAAKDLDGVIKAYSLTLSYVNSKEVQKNSRLPKEETYSNTWVNSYGVDLQMESKWKTLNLLYGVDYYVDRVYARRVTNNVIKAPSLPDGSDYELFGAFVEGMLPLANNKWELRAGSRFTYARAELGDTGNPATNNLTDSWSNFVGSGRALYHASEDWNLFAGISQAFRAPNIDDLGANGIPAMTNTFVNGGQGLKPEKYLTYELGSHMKKETVSGQVSFFFTQMKDMIVQRPEYTSSGDVVSVASNASDGWVYGVDGQIAWNFHPQWVCRLEGGWIYGKSDEYPIANNPNEVRESYLSRIPPLMGSLALRWNHPSGKYWAETRITAADRADKLNSSDSRDTSRIPPGGTPGYYNLSIYGGWNITPQLAWTAGIENVTDQSYRIHGSGVNEPGIGFVTSLRWSW